MADALDLGAIYAMLEAGDEDLLAEDEIALLPAAPAPNRGEFGENLAEWLPSHDLAMLAQSAYDGYTSDNMSRRRWIEWEKLGLGLLGIGDQEPFDLPFPGASRTIHPGLVEACIRFQARAMAELWPPEGPAKAVAEGSGINPELEQQADRVAKYLNWSYTQRQPSGYAQLDKMLFRLPLSGSAFKKVYYCPLARTVVSRFVPPEEIIVPYAATDLDTSPRVTQVLSYTGIDIKRLIEAGTYRDAPLTVLSDGEEKTGMQPDLDAITGMTQDTSVIVDHERYIILEQSIYADLPGEPPNSPYLIALERESQTVFAVYRDWREDDEYRTRRNRYAHYTFFPGVDGFYGLGLSHVLGRLAESMSGNLRALLDSGALANLQGGFRSSDVKFPKGKREDGIQVHPGKWLPVEATTEELQKMFVTIPYKEPSQVLFSLLQYLDELLRRVSGTTAELVGEATKNVPVGTTLARIEQGLQVQTQIQIRCHHAQAQELALFSQAVADNLPDAQYCLDVLNVAPEQFALDFDSRIDVRPVSDPNAVTSTQRMVIAQALVDRAAQAPDLYNREAVERRLLETMRVQDIDSVIATKQPPPRMGPVEENMAIIMTQPVKSYPDQDHAAHLAVHQQWLSTITDADTRKRVEPAAIAHISEHMAWDYMLRMQQMMGVQLPAAPMGFGQQLDPQQENALAMMSAQAAQVMSQLPRPVDPAEIESYDKAQREDEKAAAEIRRKDMVAAAQIQRDDASMIASMNRDAAEQEARLVSQFISDRAKQTLSQESQLGQGNMPL